MAPAMNVRHESPLSDSATSGYAEVVTFLSDTSHEGTGGSNLGGHEDASSQTVMGDDEVGIAENDQLPPQLYSGVSIKTESSEGSRKRESSGGNDLIQMLKRARNQQRGPPAFLGDTEDKMVMSNNGDLHLNSQAFENGKDATPSARDAFSAQMQMSVRGSSDNKIHHCNHRTAISTRSYASLVEEIIERHCYNLHECIELLQALQLDQPIRGNDEQGYINRMGELQVQFQRAKHIIESLTENVGRINSEGKGSLPEDFLSQRQEVTGHVDAALMMASGVLGYPTNDDWGLAARIITSFMDEAVVKLLDFKNWAYNDLYFEKHEMEVFPTHMP